MLERQRWSTATGLTLVMLAVALFLFTRLPYSLLFVVIGLGVITMSLISRRWTRRSGL